VWEDVAAPDWDARPMSMAPAQSEPRLAVPDDLLVIRQPTAATSQLPRFLPIRRTGRVPRRIGELAAGGRSRRESRGPRWVMVA